jgi:HEAT repeat protein
MTYSRAAFILLFANAALLAQDVTRAKDVKELGKGGSAAIPKLQTLLDNPNLEIRQEAVRQIVEIGTLDSLTPLVKATADNDPEIQVRATDGLVNFYLPGYVRTGLTASLRKFGTGIKSHFTDTNDQVIPPYMQVRPDVIAALGKLARGGARMDVRANAARAIGVLRGRAAVPDLIEAVKSKDNDAIYESLIALQKIRDQAAAPQIVFLVRDFDERVQIAAIETQGLLRNLDAVQDLVGVLNGARTAKVRRAALTAIAMLPNESSRDLYARYLSDKDDRMRGAAAEGYARLKNPADSTAIDKAYQAETKISPRLSMAFALVSLGQNTTAEFSPLLYLINTLNSNAWRGEAYPLLVEAAREPAVRQAIFSRMPSGTKDEKVWLARVLSISGDKDSLDALKKLQNDGDPDVGQEALRAVRAVEARL